METANLLECSECGHQHFNGREYLTCPLTDEGCACPMNPVDYSTADVMDNHRSFKGKGIAERHAIDYANMNDTDHLVTLGEVFKSRIWNGSEHLPVWLAYDISKTDEGWTITSYRWSSDPRKKA